MASVTNKKRTSQTHRSRPKKRRKKSFDWVTVLFFKVIALVVIIGLISMLQMTNHNVAPTKPVNSQLVDVKQPVNQFLPEFEVGQRANDPNGQPWR